MRAPETYLSRQTCTLLVEQVAPCKLKERMQPEMAALIKLSQQSCTESCVVIWQHTRRSVDREMNRPE